MAEAWAILEALKRTLTTAATHIEIQSDCKKVVTELQKQDNNFSAISTILHQIKARMEEFQGSNIVHRLHINDKSKRRACSKYIKTDLMGSVLCFPINIRSNGVRPAKINK
ncbi:hypothetical protein F8388_022711 [Cannabis sativa]|uniref:RNase H type-1 domain-containing protein n=1 Tax=Cannabis sativa TaxID=3483 RepID=A0A7J6G1X5_CANSA|nr:hypothetical protein F8388_022711 [Cannabis sativa]